MKVFHTRGQAGILAIPASTPRRYTTTAAGIIITSVVFVVVHRLRAVRVVHTGQVKLRVIVIVTTGGVRVSQVAVGVASVVVVKVSLLLLLFSFAALYEALAATACASLHLAKCTVHKREKIR